MAQRGKQFTPEMVEMVVHLKKHFDEERKTSDFISTKNSTKRTANGLGIGIATVKRIMAHYHKSDGTVVSLPAKHPGRPPDPALLELLPVVRKIIRAENLKGQRISLERLRQFLLAEQGVDIPKMTLWRAVRRWGFTYGEGRRRDSLKEKDHVIQWQSAASCLVIP
jgi:transposase